MNRNLILALALAAGCAADKAPVDDNFSELAGLDEKSDKFAGKMTIVGSLDYGQTSAAIKHKAGTWSAFKFAGGAGDQVTVDVKSSNGDTVAWVLDNDFEILAFNDDYGRGTDSHIEIKLPANASRTHYIVTRDYYRGAMKFTASLKGKPAAAFDTPCTVDADCAVANAGCCGASFVGIRADQAAAFHDSLACNPMLRCATVLPPATLMAECSNNKCVAVDVVDIACGGYTRNPHQCPADYVCEGKQMAYDAPGSCVKECGGIRGLTCETGQFCVDNPSDSCDPESGGADCMGECRDDICSGATSRCMSGYHWNQWECNCVQDPPGQFCGGIAPGAFPCPGGQTCVDNPNDSCDPAHGGADCGGICVYNDDCRAAGCGTGTSCSICWDPSKWVCIPDGALC